MLKWFKHPFPLGICIFLLASILLADRLHVVVSAGGSGSSKMVIGPSSSPPAHSSTSQNPPPARITISRFKPYQCRSIAYSKCVPTRANPRVAATSIYRKGGRIGG